MRTLVTGGAGFLGSHLVARLRAAGVDPFVVRRHDFDLTDPAAVERLFAEARPERVFHLAAEVGGIGANRASPGRFWYANLVMGTNVLEHSRRAEVDKLVLVGTICSYPKLTPMPFREEELWNGYPEETNAPYGVAKKALLVGARAYREQYGLNSTNLGTGQETAIRDLAALVAEATGFEGEIVWDTSKPNGQPRRQLDVSRAEELFGFRARTPFREGLRRTVAWYRSAAPAEVGT